MRGTKIVVSLGALFPGASVTMIGIGRGSRPTRVPAAGLCTLPSWAAEEQESLAMRLARKFGTVASQLPSAEAVTGAGQLTVGGVVSATVKVVVQVLAFP